MTNFSSDLSFPKQPVSCLYFLIVSLIKIAAGLGQCHINLFLYHHKCILEFGVQLTTMILEILIDCVY